MPSRRPAPRLVACLVAVLVPCALVARPGQAQQMRAGSMQAGSMQAGPMQAGPMGADTMTADTMGNPADKAFTDAMADMMAATEHTPPTGRTDEDFVRMMIPHHQAAVAMARTELTYGRDPELKAMANDIVTSQGKELDSMEAWLAKNTKQAGNAK